MKWRNKSGLLQKRECLIACGVAGSLCFAAWHCPGCGPGFPNSLLDGTDAQLLSAPIASFAVEIGKLDFEPSGFVASPSQPGRHAVDCQNAELDDLRKSLRLSGLRQSAVTQIIARHRSNREQLLSFLEARQSWQAQFAWISNNAVPPPSFPALQPVAGLPREFVEYFQGALAWHSGDTKGARSHWITLLELPGSERRFKSTWAAYMLGCSWEESKPRKARAYFQSVRRYAQGGFADSAGLAAASLGREALTQYRQGHIAAAIHLYLDQAAAGDPTALTSLRFTAARALWNQPGALPALARDAVSRRVITAYLVSSINTQPVHVDGVVHETALNALSRIKYLRNTASRWHRYEQAAALWLEAIDGAHVEETSEAQWLALAAYQAGEFETAARWLRKAPRNNLALWLNAKLLLRQGNVEPAASCLASIVQSLRHNAGTNPSQSPCADVEGLRFPYWSSYDADRGPQDEALGELGALFLAQSDYTQALDALVRSGFWMDAAYVAERVLTVEELQRYVEQHWPEVEPLDTDQGTHQDLAVSPTQVGMKLRHLLARRLTRLGQRQEGRPFFPAALRPQLDRLDAALQQGRNEQAPNPARARALWDAAQLLRSEGMELIGTELQPDWAIWAGNFDFGMTWEDRTNSRALPPTPVELRRAQGHGVLPESRFHYRYVAAELAWQAAAFLPDNNDETALILHTAGCWLKDRDPKAADRFYKSLVNRNRHTALGRAADKKRWFTDLDLGTTTSSDWHTTAEPN